MIRSGRALLVLARLRPLAPALALVALLALLPFDTCLLHRFAHLPCPGCGFTRALLALARGDLVASVRWHVLAPLALLAAPVVVAVAAALPADDPRWRAFTRHGLNVAAVALLAAWALRLAGVLPPV